MQNINEIMKASAGSGKTYNLALRYISLLMGNEVFPHRHILAVTFTNKATAEMKRRILDELHTLSCDPQRSPYRKALGLDDATLQKRATRALGEILSDYGSFAVSTIDRFFQQVLRAFSREIGQFAEYEVELDRQGLIDEAVARVLDALSEPGNPLRAALTSHALGRLRDGGKFHIDALVSEFAQAYFKEQFAEKAKRDSIDEKAVFSEKNIQCLQDACRKAIASFDSRFPAAARDAERLLQNYPQKDIRSHVSNYIARLCGYKGGDKLTANESAYWTDALADGGAVFKKGARYDASDAEAIRSALREIETLIREAWPERKTAALLLEQAPLFRTADALKAAFREVLKDRGVLSIDDTNQILHDIIGGTSTPFIYEKVGVRYQHFLLDEFQDTSTIQWENFLPLLTNVSGESLYNLVVGDVKQSIYRWRSAQWDILKEKVAQALQNTKETPLKVNWRSAEAIVSFNNAFFPVFAARLDADYASQTGRPVQGLAASLYADVVQETGKKSLEGSVEFSFGTSEDEDAMDKVAAAVRDAAERGFALRDIAVLVRKNSVGSEVAARLIREGIPVVSNDSLKVSSCALVRKVAARMALLDNPDDALSRYEAGPDFDPAAFRSGLSLSDLAGRLIALEDKAEVNADTPYLLAFMDRVRDFVARNGNSLHGFLDDWNTEGIKAAISSPEGSDAVTIITIHKAKGLDFPFVILPLPESMSYISTKSRSWELPDIPGSSPLAQAQKAIYDVPTASLADTFFRDSYEKELQLAMIDDINTWYVAMTRATTAMHVIVPKLHKGMISGELLNFLSENVNAVPAGGTRFLWGAARPVRKAADTHEPPVPGEELALRYLDDDVDVSSPRQLAVRHSAEDFFGQGERLENARVRGIVMHHILENVRTAEDLAASVDASFREGLLGEAEAQDALHLLTQALDEVSPRGWFSPDSARVLDERDLCDEQGNIHRPDRVIIRDGRVEIIDYKFGVQEKEHIAQVERYKRLYGKLGYGDVRGFLWYVNENQIISV
ncbi:MAG: UvrD-helicase domain-containing protein [Bacteroidales bacterium]|nr:UvrD-helicase domain-containing protein [Bacteroidales bacterium]